MKVQQKREGETLTVLIEGRIDTQTAPDLKKEIEEAVQGVKELVLDFSEVGYLSSAGLRAVLTAENLMEAAGGTMVIRNAAKNIVNVFKVTGVDSFLTLE